MPPAKNAPSTTSRPRRQGKRGEADDRSRRSAGRAAASCHRTAGRSSRSPRCAPRAVRPVAATTTARPTSTASRADVQERVLTAAEAEGQDHHRGELGDAGGCGDRLAVRGRSRPASRRIGTTRPSPVAESATATKAGASSTTQEVQHRRDHPGEQHTEDVGSQRPGEEPSSDRGQVDLQPGQEEQERQPEQGQRVDGGVDGDPAEAVWAQRQPGEDLDDDAGHHTSWERAGRAGGSPRRSRRLTATLPRRHAPPGAVGAGSITPSVCRRANDSG